MICNGKILGVLGGMGPLATADFLRLLALKSPAVKDQEHSKIIVFSNSQVPDRTKGILGVGPSPELFLKKGLETLIEWGADFLAVPCNTSHYYIDNFESKITSRLIHIVKETLLEARKVSPDGAWLNATLGTMKTELYQNYAKKMGYKLFIPNEKEQILINNVICKVKENNLDQSADLYGLVISDLLKKCDSPVVCACTELPIAYEKTDLPLSKMISSLESLVNGCLKVLY